MFQVCHDRGHLHPQVCCVGNGLGRLEAVIGSDKALMVYEVGSYAELTSMLLYQRECYKSIKSQLFHACVFSMTSASIGRGEYCELGQPANQSSFFSFGG